MIFKKDDIPALRLIAALMILLSFTTALNARVPEIHEIGTDYPDSLKKKGTGWKAFERYKHFWGTRLYGLEKIPSGEKIIRDVMLKSKNDKSEKLLAGREWKSCGPKIIPDNKLPHPSSGIGRINCVRFNTDDPNEIWLGSASGGIWVSRSNGAFWQPVDMPAFISIGISDIAIAPSNTNVIYAATGDANGFTMTGGFSTGIVKSTDGGYTWELTSIEYSLNEMAQSARILVHPEDENFVIAGTTNGIFLSNDGGKSWQHTFDEAYIRDMEFNPGNPGELLAASSGKGTAIYRSTDGGYTWSETIILKEVTRIDIASAPGKPGRAYALCVDNQKKSFHSLLRTDDFGNSWDTASTVPNILAADLSGSGEYAQGHYDLALAVAPENPDLVFAGGINIWRSNDAGETWDICSHWAGQGGMQFVHADQHDLTFKPGTVELFAANDGGLYKSYSYCYQFKDISNGLDVAQFYRIGLYQSENEILIGGTQDNGTHKYLDNQWQHVIGSDGMECFFDSRDSSIAYGSKYWGNFFRADSGNNDFNLIISGEESQERTAWITPFLLNPLGSGTLYTAFQNLRVSYDKGESWTRKGSINSDEPLTSLKVSPADTNVIIAADLNSLYISDDDGDNWHEIQHDFKAAISDLYFDDYDPHKFWISLSGYFEGEKVYLYRDGKFINISGGMPNIPVNRIIKRKGPGDVLFAGTDAGVYYYDEFDPGWVLINEKMPFVVINDLEINYKNRHLYAGTFGRGIWKMPVDFCFIDSSDIYIDHNEYFCMGDSANIKITGPEGRYKAFGMISSETDFMTKEPGVYSITIKDNSGCYGRRNIFINEAPQPPAPQIVHEIPFLICSEAHAYQWYYEGKELPDTDTNVIVPHNPGLYSVRVFNEYGCYSESSKVLVAVTVREKNNDISVSKHKGDYYINNPSGMSLSYEIFSLRGELTVKESDIYDVSYRLKNEGLTSGVYFLIIKSGGRVFFHKIIKI
ncbi:MAG: VPS10 domain-containing protein [Candidatus Kapaibacterium sp.]